MARLGPTGQTLLTNGALSAMALVSGVAAARLLEPVGRGELAAIQATVGLLAIVSSLGLSEATVYVVAQRRWPSASVILSATAMGVGASVVWAAVGWVVMPFVLAAQPEAVVSAARFYLLTLPLFAATGAAFQALRALDAFARWNLLRLLTPAGWLVVLGLSAVLDVRSGTDVARLYVVALALLSPPVWLLLRGLTSGPWRPNRRLSRPLLAFGVPTMLTALPQALSLRVDQVIIAGVLAAEQLGIYVVAVAWGGILVPLSAAIGSVLFPRVAALEDAVDQAALLATSCRRTVLVSALAAVVLAPLAGAALPLLFGPAYAGATPAAVILTVASVPLSVAFVLGEGHRGLGRPRVPLYSETIGAVVSVAALSLMVRPLGIEGAAVASALGYTTAALALSYAAVSATNVDWRELLLPRAEDWRYIVDWVALALPGRFAEGWVRRRSLR